MKFIARNVFIISIAFCFVAVFGARAYSSAESLIRDAIQKVETGSRLVEKAKNRINPNSTVQDFQVALELYIEAGQLFEQAGKIMKALGPQYIGPEDLEGCAQALQSCVHAIEELKQQIRKRRWQ